MKKLLKSIKDQIFTIDRLVEYMKESGKSSISLQDLEDISERLSNGDIK